MGSLLTPLAVDGDGDVGVGVGVYISSFLFTFNSILFEFEFEFEFEPSVFFCNSVTWFSCFNLSTANSLIKSSLLLIFLIAAEVFSISII